MKKIELANLAQVIYSSGKVFDGLSTGRLDTERFLRSGSLEGITSKSDLALLEDLRDTANFVLSIQRTERKVDPSFIREINESLTRSASIYPGKLRDTNDIGVSTRYGRHTPSYLSDEKFQDMVDRCLDITDPIESAISMFLLISRSQPFFDGNKRTGIFAANSILIQNGSSKLLSIPVDENDPSVADRFSDLLARWYMFEEGLELIDMLHSDGLIEIA